MKVNFEKAENIKTLEKLLLFIIIFSFLINMLNYFFGTWISYRENNHPSGTNAWNTAVSYNIYVSKSFRITNGHGYLNLSYKKLTKDEKEKLKTLVREFKEMTKNIKSIKYERDGFSIGKKNYDVSQLDQDSYKIYLKIVELIK